MIEPLAAPSTNLDLVIDHMSVARRIAVQDPAMATLAYMIDMALAEAANLLVSEMVAPPAPRLVLVPTD